MQTVTVKASFEKDGRSAERHADLQKAETMQEALQLEGGVAVKVLAIYNEAREADLKSTLYQSARLEIVGVDDKIERLADRFNRDRKALGKPEFTREDALARAKAQLAD